MVRPIVQVDLARFEDRKQEITKELWSAATDTGFFYLKNTGISEDEIQHMFSLSKAFFDLSPEDKAKYGFDLLKWWHNVDGKWPNDEDITGFQAFSEEFMKKCQEVSFKVLSCFALGLGFEGDFFTKNHDIKKVDAQQTFRLMHYFAVEGKTFPPGFPRAGSHCDFETITLLFAKGRRTGGLPWQGGDISARYGRRVDSLPSHSWNHHGDDKLKSNYHRVRMPIPGEDQGSRYSIAYFNQANKSAVIASKEGHYPAITAEEFVRDSLAAIYVKQEE